MVTLLVVYDQDVAAPSISFVRMLNPLAAAVRMINMAVYSVAMADSHGALILGIPSALLFHQ